MKKWWVQLDISAPQIVIPESFQDPDTSMVMVDLGHLNFNNISTDKTPDSQTNTEGECCSRPPDKSVKQKIIFLISQPKHMLWVLKRTISMRRFF